MNCKTCKAALPNLLLEPAAPGNAAARAHIAACAVCAQQFASLQATLTLLDTWQAPAVSPYFDQKLAVRLRELQSAPRQAGSSSSGRACSSIPVASSAPCLPRPWPWC